MLRAKISAAKSFKQNPIFKSRLAYNAFSTDPVGNGDVLHSVNRGENVSEVSAAQEQGTRVRLFPRHVTEIVDATAVAKRVVEAAIVLYVERD